jgi:hypothetical protein
MPKPTLLLIGYNRPELLNKRINELRNVLVEKLYISVDGGKESHNKETLDVLKKAKLTLNHCSDIKIIHHEKNLGLTRHVTSSISEILKTDHSVVVVEDDIVISKNFYENMRFGIDYLDSNNLLGTVGGFSQFGAGRKLKFRNKFRVSKHFSCWGWGCSRKTWAKYHVDLSSVNLGKELITSNVWGELSSFQKNIWISRFTRVKNNPEYTWDIQMQYASFIYNFTNLLPLMRFTNNEGFNDLRASHTKGKKPIWLKNSLLNEDKIFEVINSKALEKFLAMADANTLSGDSKLLYYRNKLR